MKQRIQSFLRRFSFRTGIIILALCGPCYIISFAQMALPRGINLVVYFHFLSAILNLLSRNYCSKQQKRL